MLPASKRPTHLACLLYSPGTFRIDYVRVWQPKGETSITCDPDDHPTTDYINRYMEYYTNRKRPFLTRSTRLTYIFSSQHYDLAG